MQTATNGLCISTEPDVADPPPGKEVVCHFPKDSSGVPEKYSASTTATDIPSNVAPMILRVDVFMPCHAPNRECSRAGPMATENNCDELPASAGTIGYAFYFFVSRQTKMILPLGCSLSCAPVLTDKGPKL
jgi:hypothetical protein